MKTIKKTDAMKPVSAPFNTSLPATRYLSGILLLVASTATLSTLDASSKWLMLAGMPVLLTAWVRYLIHVVLVLALVLPKQGMTVMRSSQPVPQLVRGLLMLLTTLCAFTTLRYLPQAEATAIIFLAPLIMLGAAPWLLREPPKRSRWIAALAGFIGVLFIVRPGSGLDPIGVLYGILTACFLAGQFIVTRRLANDHALTSLIWSGLFGTIALTLTLFFFQDAWQPLWDAPLFYWLPLLATGVFGALGHLLQIQAYRSAPASVLAPFNYAHILGACAWGWIIYRHMPDAWSWVGIAIICSSGIAIGVIEWYGAQRTKIDRQAE